MLESLGGPSPQVQMRFWKPLSNFTKPPLLAAIPAAPVDQRRDAGDERGLQLFPVEFAEQTLILSWSSHPGATAYQVVIYRADLSEALRLEPQAATELRVKIFDLPAELRGQSMLWRVEALDRGDAIASSGPGELRVP